MSWLVYGLSIAAFAVLVAAEWPRLFGRLADTAAVSRYSARRRRRRRERSHLMLVEEDGSDEIDEEREAFAESVVRDLDRLPTIDDRD